MGKKRLEVGRNGMINKVNENIIICFFCGDLYLFCKKL